MNKNERRIMRAKEILGGYDYYDKEITTDAWGNVRDLWLKPQRFFLCLDFPIRRDCGGQAGPEFAANVTEVKKILEEVEAEHYDSNSRGMRPIAEVYDLDRDNYKELIDYEKDIKIEIDISLENIQQEEQKSNEKITHMYVHEGDNFPETEVFNSVDEAVKEILPSHEEVSLFPKDVIQALIDRVDELIQKYESIQFYSGYGEGTYSILSNLPLEEADTYGGYLLEISEDLPKEINVEFDIDKQQWKLKGDVDE